MKVTYRLRAKNGATLGLGPFYTLRTALNALSLVRLMVKSGGALAGVRVEDTLPQRALTRAARFLRTAWSRRDPRYSVAAYSADRYCADGIEGGRWFDTYALEEVRYCWLRRSVAPMIDALEEEYPRTGRRYSVLGGEDYTVMGRDRFNAVPSYIDTYVPYE